MQFHKMLFILSFIGCLFQSSSALALQSGDFTYEVSGNAVTITGYTGSGKSVVIPDTIDKMPVSSIGKNAFNGCFSLVSVSIPKGVTGIGSSAFNGCFSLVSVSIPSSLTSIGASAFSNCNGLASITIPASVISIGVDAFANTPSLISIGVDANNPNYISTDGVLYNKGMTTLMQYPAGKVGGYRIPSGVTSIASCAFYNSADLTSITIPASVISIGEDAFTYCTGLTSVTIPASVSSIGYMAFYSCEGLTGAYFCGNAPRLGSSVIPGSSVFQYCASGFTVYYIEGNSGFTNPWNSYTTALNTTNNCEGLTLTTTTIATTTIGGSKPCPAQKVLGDDISALDNLRAFRNGTLAQSAVGRKIIQIYYNNADNINAALDRSPALMVVACRVLEVIALVVGGKG